MQPMTTGKNGGLPQQITLRRALAQLEQQQVSGVLTYCDGSESYWILILTEVDCCILRKKT